MVQEHIGERRYLFLGVFELHRCDIDNVESAFFRQSGRRLTREIPVDAGNLEVSTLKFRSDLVQCRVTKAGKIPPQDQVDQPLALKESDRAGVQIGPPVGLLQILRDTDIFRAPRTISSDTGGIFG